MIFTKTWHLLLPIVESHNTMGCFDIFVLLRQQRKYIKKKSDFQSPANPRLSTPEQLHGGLVAVTVLTSQKMSDNRFVNENRRNGALLLRC